MKIYYIKKNYLNKNKMNLSLDFKFGKYIIPRNFIIYQGKNFFAMVPPNPILKGRKIKKYNLQKKNVRYINMFKKRSSFNFRFNK